MTAILGPGSSPETAALVADLAKAQAEFPVASFDAQNPHFRSKYATYQACCEAVRPGLTKNGLALPDFKPGLLANGDWVMVGTLRHKSGQYISAIAPLWFGKKHMQEFGSACTYAKRTLLMALVGGFTGEPDDDGNSLGAAAPEPSVVVDSSPPPKAKKAVAKAPAAGSMGPQMVLAYENASKETIANAPDRASAVEWMNKVKVRKEKGEIPVDCYERIRDEFYRAWPREGGEG